MSDQRLIEQLPEWVPVYLSCWGSTGPDGRRMMVKTAAEMAGVTDSAVRKLRERSPQFARLEDLARFGSAERAQSMVEAGLRGMAPMLMQSFANLVREENPQVVLKAMEWIRGKAQELDVSLTGAVASVHGKMSEEDADTLLQNLILAELAEAGAGGPPLERAGGARRETGPPDLDDSE